MDPLIAFALGVVYAGIGLAVVLWADAKFPTNRPPMVQFATWLYWPLVLPILGAISLARRLDRNRRQPLRW